MAGDWIVLSVLSVPVALMGVGALVQTSIRRRELMGHKADAAWRRVAQQEGLVFLQEHALETRLVDRALSGARDGFEVALEIASDTGSNTPFTRAWVHLEWSAPNLELYERGHQPPLPEGARLVQTGDALFDRRFVLYATDALEACTILAVQARAALLALWELSRWTIPLASPLGHTMEPIGISLRRGRLQWCGQGCVDESVVLQRFVGALLTCARALRSSARWAEPPLHRSSSL